MSTVDLERPLDPDLQYYDATPSIEQLAQKVEELHRALKLQATINANILLQLQELREGQPKSSLILPERMSN